jgi:hypothetical protein
LYRVTPLPVDSGGEIKLEKINVDIGEAHGLLWAFDSLYVVMNDLEQFDSGVYRVLDTDHDDQLDTLQPLRKLAGAGEHGTHAILPASDGKSLYVVCGDGIDPAGEYCELVATGLRIQFDAAVNADGELFTYDADMEGGPLAAGIAPTEFGAARRR